MKKIISERNEYLKYMLLLKNKVRFFVIMRKLFILLSLYIKAKLRQVKIFSPKKKFSPYLIVCNDPGNFLNYESFIKYQVTLRKQKMLKIRHKKLVTMTDYKTKNAFNYIIKNKKKKNIKTKSLHAP